MAKRELYVSVDVEADGPIPGPYSMLSFGMAACGTSDENGFSATDPAERAFYAELKPISDAFDPEALAVSGLDRDRLAAEGREPAEAMAAAGTWVRETAAVRRRSWLRIRSATTGCGSTGTSCASPRTDPRSGTPATST